MYTRKTNIHLVKKMLEILVYSIWTCFAVYSIWYLTSAKRYAPITRAEARALWHIHRQNSKCHTRKCKEIRRGGRIVGFECGCGYKHYQRRPMVGNGPASTIRLEDPEYSAFDALHTTYKSK